MAPVSSAELIGTRASPEWTFVLAMVASATTVISLILAILVCGCCKKDEKKSPEAAPEAETAERKAPPKVGVGGGDKMYRTLLAADQDFVPSDKKEATKKKEIPGAYVDLGEKSVKTKKQEFASGRDPAYKSLVGVDDKFEPSARKK